MKSLFTRHYLSCCGNPTIPSDLRMNSNTIRNVFWLDLISFSCYDIKLRVFNYVNVLFYRSPNVNISSTYVTYLSYNALFLLYASLYSLCMKSVCNFMIPWLILKYPSMNMYTIFLFISLLFYSNSYIDYLDNYGLTTWMNVIASNSLESKWILVIIYSIFLTLLLNSIVCTLSTVAVRLSYTYFFLLAASLFLVDGVIRYLSSNGL